MTPETRESLALLAEHMISVAGEIQAAVRADVYAEETSRVLAVDIEGAARLLGVSATTIKSLLESGEIRSRKIGTRRVIPVAALNAYLATDEEPSCHVVPGNQRSQSQIEREMFGPPKARGRSTNGTVTGGGSPRSRSSKGG